MAERRRDQPRLRSHADKGSRPEPRNAAEALQWSDVAASVSLSHRPKIGEQVPGSVCYDLAGQSVPARGHEISADDVPSWAEPVRAVLGDDAGLTEARESLQELVKTDFNTAVLEAVLAPQTSHEEWRVGEAVAQHHLTEEFGHVFPWPDSRSTRNPNSSGGGVDLIGIGVVGGVSRFVLCEVKTSHQQAWPPAIATSRSHGLRSQLVGLLEGDDRSKWAIKYLVMNALGKPWQPELEAAMKTYLDAPSKVCVVGILVHVAVPDEKDLKANAQSLSKTCPAETDMRLIALYPHPGVLALIADAEVIVETAA